MKYSIRKIFRKTFFKISIFILPKFKPGLSTRLSIWFYKKEGLIFRGRPNYLSAFINFDGTKNYSLIELGEGITISSYVRILTHDWSLFTVANGLGLKPDKPIGKFNKVVIGDYSFVGTCSVILPGTQIGKCCLVGAGSVVRGDIPDYSIVVGSPAKVVGDTRRYFEKNFPGLFESVSEENKH